MHEQFEKLCDTIATFMWEQFDKDIEMSQRIVSYLDKTFASFYAFLGFGK